MEFVNIYLVIFNHMFKCTCICYYVVAMASSLCSVVQCCAGSFSLTCMKL